MGLENDSNIKGFTLIELLIVVAIIGILAAIAIPGYLGMQEKSKKASLIRSASASQSELQAWLNSSLKTTVGAVLIENDTNGDGVIDNSDLTNSALSQQGVCNVYATAKNNMNLKSPWNNAMNLWANSVGNGRIACLDIGGTAISIQANDSIGQIIHTKTIYSD